MVSLFEIGVIVIISISLQISGKNVELESKNYTVKFGEVIDIEIDLSKFTKNNSHFLLNQSFLSVIANSTVNPLCDPSSSVILPYFRNAMNRL